MKLREGNLEFEFDGFTFAKVFDVKKKNPYGLKCVDFFAETTKKLYFIEIKDYQDPKANKKQRNDDYKKLCDAVIPKTESIYAIAMGQKIKDSLLRQYALDQAPHKPIVYLLFINLDKYTERERGLLKTKINGYIPTGLNDNKYKKFTDITFQIVNSKQLKEHGIICTTKN